MRILALLLFLMPLAAKADTAIFAGGCFWCVEADFERLRGVREVTSGYTGGEVANPTYEAHPGHYEAVSIDFDPSVITYAQLLHAFFRSVNPTDSGGQFCDRGDAYRTAIFVLNDAQRRAAEAAKAEAQTHLSRQVVTPILEAGRFWPAEAYHQDYYKGDNIVLTRFGPRRQFVAYKLYRESCGRDRRVLELWGDAAPFVHH